MTGNAEGKREGWIDGGKGSTHTLSPANDACKNRK